MSRLGIVVVFGALIAVSASVVAMAQQRTSPPRPPGQQLPAGTYQQSCRGITLNGNILRAQCPARTGAPIPTSIDISSCRGRDITNDNGYLRCTGGGPLPPRPPVLPAGTYQQTCRGITLNGNVLRAQCQMPNGAPVTSSLDISTCRGRDITNDNGRLRCASVGPQPPRPPVLPAGTYQQTCRGITLTGNILRGQCQMPNGAPVTSSLDISTCREREVTNDNGRLRCATDTGGPRPPVPPAQGDFQGIVYTGANFTGRELVIASPIDNLASKPGFNDNIRSIRVIRGRGEICVDARYRGRCVRIDQSYRDLNAIGMDNRISSVR